MSENKFNHARIMQACKDLGSQADYWKEHSFPVDQEKLLDVIGGLRNGDISDCQAPAVTYVAYLLDMILSTYQKDPEVINEALSSCMRVQLTYYLQHIEAAQQVLASAAGFGDELARACEALKRPKQEGFYLEAVGLFMKAYGVNQNRAIDMLAEMRGKDPANIQKTVGRQKKSKNREKSKKKAST